MVSRFAFLNGPDVDLFSTFRGNHEPLAAVFVLLDYSRDKSGNMTFVLFSCLLNNQM